MNLTGATLLEVAAVVSEKLAEHDVRAVVVGGSAITAHVPGVYTSNDIDLAITTGVNHRAISAALAEIGFARNGRSYVNDTTPLTIDIVTDTPWVDQRPISHYERITTGRGSFETLFIQDAVADRVAAFLYWNDSQSLDVAERAIAAATPRPSWDVLHEALLKLESGTGDIGRRFDLSISRLKAIYDSGD